MNIELLNKCFVGLRNLPLFVCFWCDSPPSGSGPPHSRGF